MPPFELRGSERSALFSQNVLLSGTLSSSHNCPSSAPVSRVLVPSGPVPSCDMLSGALRASSRPGLADAASCGRVSRSVSSPSLCLFSFILSHLFFSCSGDFSRKAQCFFFSFLFFPSAFSHPFMLAPLSPSFHLLL